MNLAEARTLSERVNAEVKLIIAEHVAAERERCARIADDMRIKHGDPFGDPFGDAYGNGVWDQGVRIAKMIRNPEPSK